MTGGRPAWPFCTRSGPVVNLPSTMMVGTDWIPYACASCFARFTLPTTANELYTSSTFLRSSPLLAAQSKKSFSFYNGTPLLWIAVNTSGESFASSPSASSV